MTISSARTQTGVVSRSALLGSEDRITAISGISKAIMQRGCPLPARWEIPLSPMAATTRWCRSSERAIDLDSNFRTAQPIGSSDVYGSEELLQIRASKLWGCSTALRLDV